MKSLFKKIFVLTLLMFFVFIPIVSFGESGTDPVPYSSGTDPVGQNNINNNQNQNQNIPSASTKIENPIPSITSVDSFIKNILVGIIKIGLPIVALAIIYSGFLFVSAMGKPEALKKAKDALLFSVIGAAILLGAWAIAQLISDTVLEIGKSV